MQLFPRNNFLVALSCPARNLYFLEPPLSDPAMRRHLEVEIYIYKTRLGVRLPPEMGVELAQDFVL